MNTTSKKPANGCLWFVFVVVITLIFFGVIEIFINLPGIVSLILALFPAILLTLKIFGKPSIKGILINGIVIFVVFMLLKNAVSFITNFIKDNTQQVTFTAEENILETTHVEGLDTIPVYSSQRAWKDNYGNEYNGSLTIRERDYFNLKDHIKRYAPPPTGGNFWGSLYDYIDHTDTPSLDLVLETFEAINAEKQLNTMEFAEMVVSCIQDIPYSFVFEERCYPASYYEDSIKQILEKCPECCIGNILYGVQNPVSFLQNLKGDCDTRTVLIYSILKHFNYDVAIVNSDFYRHSVIGINLPASGLTKIHNGKKYILWETTAKFFEIGYLSPGWDDVNYWNVVLTSK